MIKCYFSVKLRKFFELTKKYRNFAPIRFLHLITIRPSWPKGKTYTPASVGVFVSSNFHVVIPLAHNRLIDFSRVPFSHEKQTPLLFDMDNRHPTYLFLPHKLII